MKQKDGENDKASRLDHDGVFRFNLGIPKQLLIEEFGKPPSRPGKGQAIQGQWDFTKPDIMTLHPTYGWMSWVAVLNPSSTTLSNMDGMITAAHERAKAAFDTRLNKKSDLPV